MLYNAVNVTSRNTFAAGKENQRRSADTEFYSEDEVYDDWPIDEQFSSQGLLLFSK